MQGSDTPGWIQLMQLVTTLEAVHLPFTITVSRPDAVMFSTAVPGQRWEIEVFGDGHFEIEIFNSDGQIFGKDSLTLLWKMAR